LVGVEIFGRMKPGLILASRTPLTSADLNPPQWVWLSLVRSSGPKWRARQRSSRRAAHPIPDINARTPNAAIMLPSVSQSVSKNPTTAAIAAYLFLIGNRKESSRLSSRLVPARANGHRERSAVSILVSQAQVRPFL